MIDDKGDQRLFEINLVWAQGFYHGIIYPDIPSKKRYNFKRISRKQYYEQFKHGYNCGRYQL